MFYEDYLKNVEECPFCSLNDKEILMENKSARLILAKAPYTTDHLLVVPKKHIFFLNNLTKKEKEDINKIIEFAMQKLNKKYKNASILYREGDKKKVGKSIDHMHYHVIPNLIIGAVDINLNKRRILDEKDYLKLVEKMKKEFEI